MSGRILHSLPFSYQIITDKIKPTVSQVVGAVDIDLVTGVVLSATKKHRYASLSFCKYIASLTCLVLNDREEPHILLMQLIQTKNPLNTRFRG